MRGESLPSIPADTISFCKKLKFWYYKSFRLMEADQSPESFNKIIDLVKNLNSKSDLSDKFVNWHSARLQNVFSKFAFEEGASKDIRVFVEEISSSALNSLIDTCIQYEKIFLSKFIDSKPEEVVRSDSESDGYETDNEEELEADEDEQRDEECRNKLKLEEASLRARLGDFAKPLLTEYLALIKHRFDQEKCETLAENSEEFDGTTTTGTLTKKRHKVHIDANIPIFTRRGSCRKLKILSAFKCAKYIVNKASGCSFKC